MSTLAEVARRLGARPEDLAAVIQFESGGNPRAVNKSSGASGLIQLMPSTARRLGTSVEAIRTMSAEQQLDLVERYLAPYRGRLGTLQGVAMAVFYPAAIGWAENSAFPPAVQRANPGIRTVADYLDRVRARSGLARVERARPRGRLTVGGAVLLSASVLLLAVATRRRFDPRAAPR